MSLYPWLFNSSNAILKVVDTDTYHMLACNQLEAATNLLCSMCTWRSRLTLTRTAWCACGLSSSITSLRSAWQVPCIKQCNVLLCVVKSQLHSKFTATHYKHL